MDASSLSFPLTYADGLRAAREWFSRPGAVFGYVRSGYEPGDGGCVYRGDGDPESPVRCAIGCLMPDEWYRSDFENSSIESLCDLYLTGFLAPDDGHGDRHCWSRMQSSHDEFAVGDDDSSLQHFVGWLDDELERVTV